MNENSNIVPLRQPNEIDDPLTNILRSGARRLLAQAVEIEAAAFLAAMKDLKLPNGRDRLVRHGHGPTRTIQTGIGPVEVERVKIRDRGVAADGERVHVGDLAVVGAADEELGRAFAGALLAGHLDR
jgi:putative transposase